VTRDLKLRERNVAKYLPCESKQVINLGAIEVASTEALPEVLVGLAWVLNRWGKHVFLFLPFVLV
jgi:hypothetical protein